MYVPREFACDQATALSIVDAFPFALVVVPGLDAVQVPLLRRGENTLLGHVARGSTFASAIERRLSQRADGLVHGIAAFELRVERLVGKQKLGQNRKPIDQEAAARALSLAESDDERWIGREMMLAHARRG